MSGERFFWPRRAVGDLEGRRLGILQRGVQIEESVSDGISDYNSYVFENL